MKGITPFNNLPLLARGNSFIALMEEVMQWINARVPEMIKLGHNRLSYVGDGTWYIENHFIRHPVIPQGCEIGEYTNHRIPIRDIGEIPNFHEWIKYLREEPNSQFVRLLLEHLIEGGANARLVQSRYPGYDSISTPNEPFTNMFKITIFFD